MKMNDIKTILEGSLGGSWKVNKNYVSNGTISVRRNKYDYSVFKNYSWIMNKKSILCANEWNL